MRMLRDSILLPVRRQDGSRGAALLYVVGALLVLGALGAGIAVMSPSSMQSKLEQEAGMRAYYNAQSGMSFIYSRQAVYEASGNSLTNFLDAMGGNKIQTYYIPGGGQFAYQLSLVDNDAINGNFSIYYLTGAVGDASGNQEYSYLLYGGEKGTSGSIAYSAVNSLQSGGADKVLASYGSAVSIAGSAVIVGNVYGLSVTAEQASITGDVTSQGDANLNYKTSVTGNLCSGGDATLDQTTVTGSVNAQGNVYLKYNSIVGGSVYAGGNIIMDGSVTVGGSVHAQGYTQLGYADNIAGNAYSNGNINFVGTSAVISNNAYSGSTINLSWASSIVKQAVACNPFDVVNGSSVGSKIISCSYPPNIKPTAPTAGTVVSSPTVKVFTAGTTNIYIPYNTNTYSTSNPLPPGKYNDLTVGGKSPISFTAGTYYFNSISVAYNSIINLDVSGGDITIFVTGPVDNNATGGINVSSDGAKWKDMTKVDKMYAAKVYLEAHDTITLEYATNWFGTLFSTKSIMFSGDNIIIGSYATTGTDTLSWANSVTYVCSDYALAHWK